jgi:hypothetical protein
MKAFRQTSAALALLALLSTACARPLLVAPIRLSVPLGSHSGANYDSPVIDGDTVMVLATLLTSDGQPAEKGIHVFERDSNGAWNYAGQLLAGPAAVYLQGTLAVAQASDVMHVFERGAQGWEQTATLNFATLQGQPFAVDDGAIYMHAARPASGCARADWVMRKVNGQWQEVASIGAPNCGDGRNQTADVNDGRALVVNEPPDLVTPQPPADVFVDNGTASWPRAATLPAPLLQKPPGYIPWFGPTGAITNNWALVNPTFIYRNNGGNNWVRHARLVEPEVELNTGSYGGTLRGNTLVVDGEEWDYELPFLNDGMFTDWRTLRVYRPRSNGYFDYYARLSFDYSHGFWSVSSDGRRVVGISANSNYLGDPSYLLVFEIPDSASFAATQQDTFENGNFSRWTPTGGQFAVAANGPTRVLRQTSLAGDAGAYLAALDWGDQSIEADFRPLEYAGNDRWFGLVARRVDANNYYYVTFRASGAISIRRMQDGVVTPLPYPVQLQPFVAGRNYRVRFEAVGDQLAVFVNGIPRAHVKDSTFTHGHPGIAGYRASFELDNIVVSPATRLLVRLDTAERQWANEPADLTGAWSYVGDAATGRTIRRQSDTSGDARWFSTSIIGNQVVSARVRPMSFGATTGTQDPWVGIAAHVVDAQNYYYVTLRRSNQVSLRKVVNGTVQVIATVPQTVTSGTWYDLRLEIIGTNIRAFVNGDLKMQTTDPTMSGGGRNALLTYKTAADNAEYVAYQP